MEVIPHNPKVEVLFAILKWKTTNLFKVLVNTGVPFRRVMRWMKMGMQR